MELNFTKLQEDVEANREEITEKLIIFSRSDALLFWSSDKKLQKEQERLWLPVLVWANNTLNTDFKSTIGLEVENTDKKRYFELKNFLEGLSGKEITALYLTAINTRSVLLGVAMVNGYGNAEQIFDLAELEELYQANRWGHEEVAEARRQSIKDTLKSIEKYLKS